MKQYVSFSLCDLTVALSLFTFFGFQKSNFNTENQGRPYKDLVFEIRVLNSQRGRKETQEDTRRHKETHFPTVPIR